ncbi:hemolysin family protein [uncultured Selenomonas sp.]|uniref:hemolysin family protein n=1 Tax=uncultured Selenomonas sp. TaxID=159275 RepID=UPI0028E4D04B|nr:hemolysin family protein [uncultured Selenomonas sp.]
MDSSLSDLIALVLLIICLAANAYFAQVETALTASHRGRLERLADDGDKDAAQALVLLEHASPPLAMAQAGITCTSLLMGLGIGLLVAPTFGKFLAKLLPGMEVFAAALVLSLLLMTALTLLFGDFLPKQIALQDPESILMRSHRTIRLLTRLTALPSTALVSVSRGLLLLVGVNPESRASATEDAVKDLMEQGTEDGTFEKAEQDMVDRIFHMSDQTASALMTPRTQIAWIDLAEPKREQLRVIRRSPHDVFPVAYENLDDFRGVVYAKELLDAALDGAEINLENYIRKPLFVPRTMEGLRVLEKFRTGAIHEAVVLDEYGGVVGFITMDDIMEEIIGSANGDAPTGTRTGAEETEGWVFDGLFPIDEFKEEFDIDELPDEDHDHFHTLGGFVTAQIGRIPKVGETCTWDDYTFEVLRMDRARVAQIRMRRTEHVDGES